VDGSDEFELKEFDIKMKRRSRSVVSASEPNNKKRVRTGTSVYETAATTAVDGMASLGKTPLKAQRAFGLTT
jgi:hypothetical protein